MESNIDLINAYANLSPSNILTANYRLLPTNSRRPFFTVPIKEDLLQKPLPPPKHFGDYSLITSLSLFFTAASVPLGMAGETDAAVAFR